MPDPLQCFERSGEVVGVVGPGALAARLAGWAEVRRAMARHRPDAFTRDEWAYLMTFLGPGPLGEVVRRTFGVAGEASPASVDVVYRPRDPVAVWLPGNVSLLGPLVLVVASLSGATVHLKASTDNEDLAGEFLAFVTGASHGSPWGDDLAARVRVERFDRSDARNATLAAEARVRIVFGSDEAIDGVDRLPHPVHSTRIGFGDRRSEAWLDHTLVDDATIDTLIRVFTVYGQAGCTSPGRVVLRGATAADAEALAVRMLERWPALAANDVPMHHAAQNVMVRQWAAATGWWAALAPRHAAVIAAGSAGTPAPQGTLFLPIVFGDDDELFTTMPSNLQTVGTALAADDLVALLPRLVAAGADRIVPLARMHHFGVYWDGHELLRELYDTVEVGW